MANGFTLWFTGLSGAGKSTIAELVGDPRRRFVFAAAARERALAYDVANEDAELLARYAALVDATEREPTPYAA